MPKKVSIQESVFKTEPAFTRYIANNNDVATRLLETIGVSMNEDYKVEDEYICSDGKRIDLVIKDRDDKILIPIECQDAKGFLDMEHATKIRWYMRDVDCTTGIILCEGANEYVQMHVRADNEKSDLDVYVLVYDIVDYGGDEPHVTFNVLVNPLLFPEKKRRVNASLDQKEHNTSDPVNRAKAKEELKEKYMETGLFTSNASEYCVYRFKDEGFGGFDSTIEPPYPGVKDVSMHPKLHTSGKPTIHFYHAGNLQGHEGFDKQMTALAKEVKQMQTVNKKATIFTYDSSKECLEAFKILKEQHFKPKNA